jgi:hypothetical protein
MPFCSHGTPLESFPSFLHMSDQSVRPPSAPASPAAIAIGWNVFVIVVGVLIACLAFGSWAMADVEESAARP